jgi:trigger factor
MADEEKDEQTNETEGLDELEEAGEFEEQEEGAEKGKEESLEDKLKEVIDVQVEDLAPLRRKLTISVPRDTLDDQVKEQYDELRREAMVPGFRKGRAPRRLLEKRFGNEVGETLVQQLVSTGYMAAVDKAELKVLGDPLIYVKGDGEGEVLEEVQPAIAKMKLPPEGPLVFSCEVEIRPEITLPSLDGIPVEKPTVSISDEDVETQVKRLQSMRGTLETISEGAIQADDYVTANLKITAEGQVLKEEEGVRLAARPQVVDGVVLEKLGEKLTGAKTGDTVTVTGTIPEDYPNAEYRGKEGSFEFSIKEVQRMRLPEMTDEFIKSWGFESEKDLRDFIRQDLESDLGAEIRRGMRGQIAKYLLDSTSFDLPERLSNRQINMVTTNRVLELYRRGVPPQEAEKMMDDLKTSSREDAINELKLAFVMEKLAEEIEVEVSEGEINSQIAAIARRQGQRFDRVRDQLAKQGSLTTLYLRLRDDKILDELIGKANVTEAKLEDIKERKKSGKKKPEGEAKKAEKEGAGKAEATEPESGEAPAKPREQIKRTPPKKGKKADQNLADET